MHPTQPLRTRSQPRLNAESKRLGHFFQRTARLCKNNPQTQYSHRDIQCCRLAGRHLPCLTQFGREAFSTRRGLSELRGFTRAVVSNRTGRDQSLRRNLQSAHPFDELLRQLKAAGRYFTLVTCGPAAICKPRTSQVNHRINIRFRVRQLFDKGELPLVLPRTAGQNCHAMALFKQQLTRCRTNQTRTTRYQDMHCQPLSFVSRAAIADPEKYYDVYVV